MKKLFVYIIIFCLAAIIQAEDDVLKLSFIGDVMAHDVNYKIKDFNAVYAKVKPLLINDDLTIANLEFPVSETLAYSTYPRFNVHREYVQAVIDAGVDIFSLANNHSYDKGSEGIYQTLISMLMLKEAFDCKIAFSGIRGNVKQKFKPVTLERNGYKVGFIAVTAISNIYPSEPYINIINYGKEEAGQEFLDYIKTIALNYDLLIVSYHAGNEYQYKPNAGKTVFFKKIIEAGAHIVYGHHPHVLQPVEVIKVNGLNRLIIYSAGNFISGQRWYRAPIDVNHYRSYTGDSAIFQVEVEKKAEGVNIRKINLELITNHINAKRQVVVEKFTDILADTLSKEWKKYYQERYKLMQKFIPDVDIIK